MMPSQWQALTAAQCYQNIARGTALWIALGTFLDDWRWQSKTNPSTLSSLLADPISPLPGWSREAAFLQGIAEQLCLNADLPVPAWIACPRWILEKPWFLYPGWRLRAWQLADTPAVFKARNIFGGDRMLDRV